MNPNTCFLSNKSVNRKTVKEQVHRSIERFYNNFYPITLTDIEDNHEKMPLRRSAWMKRYEELARHSTCQPTRNDSRWVHTGHQHRVTSVKRNTRSGIGANVASDKSKNANAYLVQTTTKMTGKSLNVSVCHLVANEWILCSLNFSIGTLVGIIQSLFAKTLQAWPCNGSSDKLARWCSMVQLFACSFFWYLYVTMECGED